MTVVYASPARGFGFPFCLSRWARVEVLLELQSQTKDVKWGVWRSKEENPYTSSDRKNMTRVGFLLT